MKILSNKAQCQSCLEVIESKHRHDFVACKCYKNEINNTGIAVDGGLDYLRRSGNIDSFIELSEYEEDNNE